MNLKKLIIITYNCNQLQTATISHLVGAKATCNYKNHLLHFLVATTIALTFVVLYPWLLLLL